MAPRQQLPQTVVLQTPPPHKLDVWLPRLANFTQVGLLLLTAGGFYFTVLPLSQKALLDEAFARKEVELKQVTASLESKYVKLRGVAIHGFTTNADLSCSGFEQILGKPIGKEVDESQAFDIDVKKCLMDYEARSPHLSELRTNDRTFFRARLAEVADKIVKLQSEAAANYRRAEQDINDDNVDVYAGRREFSARMLKFLTQHTKMPPEQIAARKRQSAVEELRAQRVDAYWKGFRSELHTLTRLAWPT